MWVRLCGYSGNRKVIHARTTRMMGRKSVHAPIILVEKKINGINELSKGSIVYKYIKRYCFRAKKIIISLAMHTVKLYEASSLPMFLIVTLAVPTWLKASNVGTLMSIIFPGLLKLTNQCKVNAK
mgnify:FL=1